MPFPMVRYEITSLSIGATSALTVHHSVQQLTQMAN
jgi:hypothetical protein